ncbi:MAG: primosomal protein N' [Desulfarculaceae bacterium]|nr:primosomal protein N' [Desulfarculaceae bacterium]MCF8073776.1 primosomal protein N' [Desulfarculaceae bacterium]MCF8102017.1 primosomal protein N' [Desulfarculaceae bacterium]MCF8115987.1 primosomal protein N' [Desulfarculaceae bacterium]
MPPRLDVALAAPLWRPLSYAVAPELAPIIRPLTRLLVPVRGKPRLAFALGAPQEGDTEGLKPVSDVLDEAGAPQLIPSELLGFFTRAAAYYQAPLGQALAWSLPGGLGGIEPGAIKAPGRAQAAWAAWRDGDPDQAPRPGTQGAKVLELLLEQSPRSLDALRPDFPGITAIARRLEAGGWLSLTHKPVVKDLIGRPILPEPEPEAYSDEQAAALAQIEPAIKDHTFRPFLLYGITGSGKTEVYVASCAVALATGRQALVLAPEIGLCLRLEGLLKERFGPDKVAVLHSGLSPAVRRGQWLAIARGETPIVVGARSAVFAPLANLGVICLDEEQDESYKQNDRLRYHARDMALLRAQEQACPVVLGTATPAVTTYERARQGGLETLRLTKRIKQAVLPLMEVVDLKSAGKLAGGFLSLRLKQAIEQTVAQGRQVILFLNRRGFAPALICPSCGQRVGCPACSLSLTLHKKKNAMVCHTCGHNAPIPAACPSCGQGEAGLKPLGLGTEQVSETLQQLLPDMRLGRLDRDAASSPAQLRQVLSAVAKRELDVIVGTQMLTKGHHLPGIGLVGILLADQALSLPDFRAAERAYILLTQAAGRAGREGEAGRVIVQTFDPHHHAVTAALAHDPEAFYAEELDERRALGYPPFARLVGLRLEGASEAATARASHALARALEQARAKIEPRAAVLGPAPAPIARAAGRWRWLILLKSPTSSAAAEILRLGRHRAGPPPSGVRLLVDVDPLSLI